MSITFERITCPQCSNPNAERDFNPLTGEEHIACPACSYRESIVQRNGGFEHTVNGKVVDHSKGRISASERASLERCIASRHISLDCPIEKQARQAEAIYALLDSLEDWELVEMHGGSVN